MNMAGKVVVITGAARGLGRQTAQRLKQGGAIVVGIDVIGNSNVALDAFFQVDLCHHAEVDAVVAAIGQQFGDVDILVNNAGTLSLEHVGSGVTDTVRRAFEVNLFGAWHLTAALLPGLLRRHGRVVNVSSLFALVNAPYVASYAASKRALAAWSDVLRLQHRSALDVVTVFPGFIDTAIHGPAEQAGLSVKRLVSFRWGGRTLLTLEESLSAAAAGMLRACASTVRNRGLTRLGTLTMFTARMAPALVDAFIAWRLSMLIRSGQLALRSEMIE